LLELLLPPPPPQDGWDPCASVGWEREDNGTGAEPNQVTPPRAFSPTA